MKKMMENSVNITVFTPTYNRANCLGKLYESLLRQSYTDFEWLIVDDGSTDETEIIVDGWRNNYSSFNIRYIKQTNGGKCKAINTALDYARGKLFFTVDSDDYLTDDALEKVDRWEKELPLGECFCGVAGNLGTAINYSPNKIIEAPYFDGTFLDRYTCIDGERAFVIYTDIHRKYKYPVFEEEKFMTEAVVWNRMAHDGYRIRYYNDIIWIYEYRDDGLTRAGNSLFVKNPRGYALWLREKYIYEKNWSILNRIKYYYSMNAELRNNYSMNFRANCMNTSMLCIYLCDIVYRIKRKYIKMSARGESNE